MDAGSVLQSARRRARLTQSELAARANVTQSVVSAYESGRRQPSVPMLAALISATGYELDLQVHAVPKRLDPLVGPVGLRVRHRRRQIIDVAYSYGLRNVHVFGSVARGEDTDESDLDLLVELPPDTGLFELARARQALEEVVETRVDLVPADGLKPSVRDDVDADKIML